MRKTIKYTRSVLLMLLMAAALQVSGQGKEILKLWPASATRKPAVVAADTSNRVKRIGEVTDPLLEVFRPAHPNGAAVVICPGGGYYILAIDLEGYEIASWLNGLGHTAFVLQYSVPKKKDSALQDLQRAMRLVKARASTWNLDTARIGVLGFSAGASLSARLSTRYDERLYQPVDKADSISARPWSATLVYPAYLDDGEGHSLTPELKVNAATPPTFLFATEDDPVGNSSLVYASALRAVKAPFEVHVLPKGGHGYGLRRGNVAAEAWPVYWQQWADRLMKGR